MDFREQNLKLEKLVLPKVVTYQLATSIGFVPVVVLGAYLLIIKGELSLPLYLLFLLATLRLYLPLEEIVGDKIAIKQGSAGLTKVNNIYENKSLPETAKERKIKQCAS